MNILIVDDEPAVRRLEMRVLDGAGHRCVGAGSCAEALTVLNREPIDVALVDVRMPGESGLVLGRTMQRDHPTVAVIMATGLADFSSVTEARLVGAVDYLVKPVGAQALIAAVARAGDIRKRKGGTVMEASAETVLSPHAPLAQPSPGDPAIDRLFRAMCAAGASDLHLSATMPPLIRKDGEMMPLDPDANPLSVEDIVQLVNPIIPGKNRQEFESEHDSDFAYEIPALSRFRGNVFLDRNGMAAVFRIVPNEIVSAEALGLTPSMLELCALKKGLVLVTGPTGSGKSTTLAAMIDYINRTRSEHIITIEDPIEFVHVNRRCLVNQREVHSHTRSFKTALRAALREDPDIVLIGEMRDLETAAIALETAETGHLVFGTLHTTTAASTVDRIIDQFPAERQAQIRVMLSESLKGVIAQTLCRQIGGGRVAAWEILVVNHAISNLIREGKTFQIPAMMQMGRAAGMVTLNDALLDLVRGKRISVDEALARAIDKAAFSAMLSRGAADRSSASSTAVRSSAAMAAAE